MRSRRQRRAIDLTFRRQRQPGSQVGAFRQQVVHLHRQTGIGVLLGRLAAGGFLDDGARRLPHHHRNRLVLERLRCQGRHIHHRRGLAVRTVHGHCQRTAVRHQRGRVVNRELDVDEPHAAHAELAGDGQRHRRFLRREALLEQHHQMTAFRLLRQGRQGGTALQGGGVFTHPQRLRQSQHVGLQVGVVGENLQRFLVINVGIVGLPGHLVDHARHVERVGVLKTVLDAPNDRVHAVEAVLEIAGLRHIDLRVLARRLFGGGEFLVAPVHRVFLFIAGAAHLDHGRFELTQKQIVQGLVVVDEDAFVLLTFVGNHCVVGQQGSRLTADLRG